jgi:hypothetical protein
MASERLRDNLALEKNSTARIRTISFVGERTSSATIPKIY